MALTFGVLPRLPPSTVCDQQSSTMSTDKHRTDKHENPATADFILTMLVWRLLTRSSARTIPERKWFTTLLSFRGGRGWGHMKITREGKGFDHTVLIEFSACLRSRMWPNEGQSRVETTEEQWGEKFIHVIRRNCHLECAKTLHTNTSSKTALTRRPLGRTPFLESGRPSTASNYYCRSFLPLSVEVISDCVRLDWALHRSPSPLSPSSGLFGAPAPDWSVLVARLSASCRGTTDAS